MAGVENRKRSQGGYQPRFSRRAPARALVMVKTRFASSLSMEPVPQEGVMRAWRSMRSRSIPVAARAEAWVS